MSQDPFGEIPLFKELQRLLTSSSGPVNLEIAGQIAAATVAAAGPDPRPDPEAGASYQRAVIGATQLLSGYTRLSPDEAPRAEAISRHSWIESTLTSWGWLMEDFAERFKALGDQPESHEQPGLGAVMEQLAPLMMGLQAGALVGSLATESLYRHELPIPRDDEGHLFVVTTNARSIASNYDFDPDDLTAWIALRDAGRQLVVSTHPWVDRYLRSALSELIASIEIDIGDVERRMMELQSRGMEGLEGISIQDALPVVHTERHRVALNRLQALAAVFEGYASHAGEQVASELVPSYTKISDGMTRHYASPSEGKQALTSILGISLERQTVAAGTTFCAAVVKMRGIAALNTVWAAPDNLPSLDEIRDPFAWMERVLDG